MRVDKFLKVSRLIKRRSVAKEACDSDKIIINGKISKPSSKLKENDILEIKFSDSLIKVRILELKPYTRKENACEMYEIIN